MKKEYGSLATHRGFLGKPPLKGAVDPFPCSPSKVFATQVAGLVRRLRAIRCKDVVIGLSGGLDSALVLLVADAAFRKLGLDRKGIHVYTMPGFGTSGRTKGNAELLCEGLGLRIETISIAKSVRQHLRDIGHDGKTPDVTYENAQARMRTMILMDKANMVDGIVLGTGDMSEIALGWCTYNGDHMSMFGVNSGVPKTVVRKVCSWWADRNVKCRIENVKCECESDKAAKVMKAELLVILSNVDGVFTGNPDEPGSELIHDVYPDEDYSQYVGSSKSKYGRGGMMTKMNTALGVAADGIEVRIANGRRQDVLLDVLTDPENARCTRFHTKKQN